ncbi:MAG: hypothetical protein CVV64_09685 [Candidatus Wallbacteria bacterium HGW-Wallbacteria-1]|uniref:Acyltransferase 3 domain-containing protein n=1 Tax=Candidatus Wallbacteria bacterium HGW-Wallbacteria-1 TaxID=2013854 RepID=A0A2N1PQK6_9BACT|nr:MAG: hypothetical protein CVV64_09685 [Candidatus Wallbacteria bacterium HGW-Wallbacteria-1]
MKTTTFDHNPEKINYFASLEKSGSENSGQNLEWLDNSRIIATSAVILLHVSQILLCNHKLGTINWWIGNFYDSLVRWCVPAFIMLSGALLLNPDKKSLSKAENWSYIPYFILGY